MKIIIGSVIMLILIVIGVWLLLTPLFRKAGSVTRKGTEYLKKTFQEEVDKNE